MFFKGLMIRTSQHFAASNASNAEIANGGENRG